MLIQITRWGKISFKSLSWHFTIVFFRKLSLGISDYIESVDDSISDQDPPTFRKLEKTGLKPIPKEIVDKAF